MQFDEFQIVSSSHDDTIIIWDFLNTGPDVPNMALGDDADEHMEMVPQMPIPPPPAQQVNFNAPMVLGIEAVDDMIHHPVNQAMLQNLINHIQLGNHHSPQQIINLQQQLQQNGHNLQPHILHQLQQIVGGINPIQNNQQEQPMDADGDMNDGDHPMGDDEFVVLQDE